MSQPSPTRKFMLILPALYVAIALIGWNRAPVHDEIKYLQFAARIAPGIASPADELDLWQSPGYGLFLSPFVAMKFNYGLLRLLNAALLFGAVLCFHRFLRNLVTPRRALAGAWMLGLYFPFWKQLPMLMAEILAVCLVCFVLWSWSEIIRRHSIHWGWFIAGACGLAALCLTRVIFGYVTAVCCLLWLVLALTHRTQWRPGRMAVVHIFALILCLPWLWVTYAKTHKLFYWSSSGGLSFYWMTTPFAGEWGDWHSPENVLTNERFTHHRPVFRDAQKLYHAERDAAYKAAAIRNLRKHPWKVAKNVAANISRMFFSYPYTHTPLKPTTFFYAVPNALILLLLLAGITGLFKMPRTQAAAAFPYILPGAIAFAASALLSAYARMLFPLVPVILFIILYGFGHARLTGIEATRAKS